MPSLAPWKYEPYERLSDSEKRVIGTDYLHKFSEFDSDIIVNSAAEVLIANQFNDFTALQVGPEIPGGEFHLDTQITKECFEHRYVFFAFPARKGTHSVAVVIDNKERKCFLLDSQIMYYKEVEQQLKQAIPHDYQMIRPHGDAVLFQQEDEWSCGVHTSANIVGIITGDINLETGKGISVRTDEDIQHLLGIFVTAYHESSVKHEKKLVSTMQIKTMRLAIDSLLDEQNQQLDDLVEFHCALSRQYPINLSDEQLIQKITHIAFIKMFCEEHKNNSFTRCLTAPELIKKLPQTMQDNVERTTQTLRVFLSEEIKLNRLLSKLNLDQTDRSLPHFAKALRRASANNYHDDVQFILNIHPEVLNYPDPNIKTQNTALHLATERGHCKVVEALLQANADQKILNASGKTAIMMASELKDNAVIQSILALYELNKKQDQGPPISPVCQNTSSWPMRFFSSTTNAVVSIIQSLRNK